MKRVIRIGIDNYKAYIVPRTLAMPNGENVLLYGENGSGKSSLYKAIRYFLSSSVGVGQFETNKFSGRNDGRIKLTYIDIDNATHTPIAGSEHVYIASTDPTETTTAEPFIRLSHRVSGFLDYTQLLRAYFVNGGRPDLFDLVVDLIGEHIPLKEGMSAPFKKEMTDFLKEIRGSYHRSDWAYTRGKNRFESWKLVFLALMGQLDTLLSHFMTNYFADMNMRIKLAVPTPQLKDDGYIRDASVDAHIYVDVEHYGQVMTDYNVTLNEARLSAIAICLYLASLKLKADNIDSKILYLDDVFLGLDLGNRKPILDILLNEFTDYQLFISTYDRSWYVQAKEILADRGGWIFYELYEGTTENAAGQVIANPIVIKDDSFFERACAFLNDNEHPDYPAAANYLRKAFEKLLQKHFYEPAVREEQCEMIPVFKLTQLVDACRIFVRQLPAYTYSLTNLEKALTELKNTLHPLLHPLSHYAPDVPVYKAEVVKAIRLYQQISVELQQADFDSHCRVFQERGRNGRLELKGAAGWKYVYTVKLLSHLYLMYDNVGSRSISNVECRVINIEETMPGMSIKNHQVAENSKLANIMKYNSLQDCHNQLVSFLATNESKTDTIAAALEDCFSFPDVSNRQQTIKDAVATFVW